MSESFHNDGYGFTVELWTFLERMFLISCTVHFLYATLRLLLDYYDGTIHTLCITKLSESLMFPRTWLVFQNTS